MKAASFRRALARLLARLDAACNRLYGWRGNPLYHSGALTVFLMLVLLVTGLYLVFFYRVGAPFESVARINAQPWLGRWIRGLHRYASDAAVVTALVHAVRLFAQGRSWGPRVLAWVSGLALLGLILVCGWTGYVMVWDLQGQVLAEAGARLLDLLPIFSEPISRAFVSERTLPPAFFFLNLFLHLALPIGLIIGIWIHVSRLARPALFPPRALGWGLTAALTVVALLWPLGMAPPASYLARFGPAPYDLFYAGWLPLLRVLSPGSMWLLILLAGGAVLLVPWWSRPRTTERPLPSVVDQHLCTGCRQCAEDCPWEAIEMVPRPDGREGMVAQVDPSRCVSCGLCAGSCAPMGVGPPGRTGRDQLVRVREWMARRPPGPLEVVLVACDRGAGGAGRREQFEGAPVWPVACAGNLHTSVVELLVRGGAGGVLVVACPPRDCWNREGVRWLEQRLFHDREAELKARVDRRRVRLVFAGEGDGPVVRAALRQFRAEVEALEQAGREESIDLDALCEAVTARAEEA